MLNCVTFRQKYSYDHFLPSSCLRKMKKRSRKVVIAAFDKFYSSANPLSDGKLKLKYLEIAEKSSVLEYHNCQATMVRKPPVCYFIYICICICIYYV